MNPPGGTSAGTFLANVRGGAIQFPPPIRQFCNDNRWTLFQVAMLDDDRLEIVPVLPGDDSDMARGYQSSLSEEGRLWIPKALRELVSLGEQSVMVRIEDGAIRIYLRKVFKTLGFGP
ncbi:MAG: hypothetical protein ABUS51_02180 [Acidobacteriota bacterium]